jgi:hypothetical protein
VVEDRPVGRPGQPCSRAQKNGECGHDHPAGSLGADDRVGMCARLGHEVAQRRLETALRVEDALSDVWVRHCDRSSTSLGTLVVAPAIWPEFAAERDQAARVLAATAPRWRWGREPRALRSDRRSSFRIVWSNAAACAELMPRSRTASASVDHSHRRHQACSSAFAGEGAVSRVRPPPLTGDLAGVERRRTINGT